MRVLVSAISRLLFIGAFLLAGLAIWEKVANILHLTLLRNLYNPWRILEFAAIILLFLIALQLREIRLSLGSKGS